MSKTTIWKCDECDKELTKQEKNIKIKMTNNETGEYLAFNLCLNCLSKLPLLYETLSKGIKK